MGFGILWVWLMFFVCMCFIVSSWFGFFCFSQVPSPLLLSFFSALVRLELREPVLPKCKSCLVAFAELHQGIFFPEWKTVMERYRNVSGHYLMAKSVKFFHVQDDFG